MASLYTEVSFDEYRNRATFTCYYSGLQSDYSGSRQIEYDVGDSLGSRSISGTSGSISVTISVTPGRTYGYTFWLEWRNQGDTDWSTAVTDQGNYTVPLIPSISEFTVTQTAIGQASAQCYYRASSLDAGAEYVIEAQSSNNRWYEKDSGRASSSGNITISFNGFGYYPVRITITNESGYSATEYYYITLVSVTKWNWYSSNGDATYAQTSAAYNAIRNNGNTSDFSYLVWNDLCAKAKEILDASGGSWDSTYASYNNTLISSGDKTLTARKFNSLRYNIGIHYSTGISEVSTGDTVYGWYFETLASSLNGWIDNM